MSKELFIRGKSLFYTPVIGTTDLPPQDVKARIEWSNTPERLNTFFFGDEALKLLRVYGNDSEELEPDEDTYERLKSEYEDSKKEIYLVSVKRPTSGYSEAALLAATGRISQLTGESKSNDLVYDYPEFVRNAYWDTVCGVMEKFCNLRAAGLLPEKFKNLKPVVMGHHGRELSKYPPFENNPGIRTVILHHDHLVFVDESSIEPDNWDPAKLNLDKEDELFWNEDKPLLPEFVEQLNADSRLKEIDIKFKVRMGDPVGYEVDVNYGGQQNRKLTEFLQAHFLAYSHLVKSSDLLSHSVLIQPAFTFYFVPGTTTHGKIIFSPNIFASENGVVAGGPERAGLLISRRPDIAPVMTEQEKILFGKMLVR